jgi:hypothetical protein
VLSRRFTLKATDTSRASTTTLAADPELVQGIADLNASFLVRTWIIGREMPQPVSSTPGPARLGHRRMGRLGELLLSHPSGCGYLDRAAAKWGFMLTGLLENH